LAGREGKRIKEVFLAQQMFLRSIDERLQKEFVGGRKKGSQKGPAAETEGRNKEKKKGWILSGTAGSMSIPTLRKKS